MQQLLRITAVNTQYVLMLRLLSLHSVIGCRVFWVRFNNSSSNNNRDILLIVSVEYNGTMCTPSTQTNGKMCTRSTQTIY